jgi:hypothetical protein
MRQLGPNMYHIDLPPDLHLSPIFNVEDLTAYFGQLDDPTINPVLVNVPNFVKPRKEKEDILKDQIVSMRCGGYPKFLVKWNNCPLSDCCWLQIEEVQCLNPYLYELYQSCNSPKASSF